MPGVADRGADALGDAVDLRKAAEMFASGSAGVRARADRERARRRRLLDLARLEHDEMRRRARPRCRRT